MSNRTEVNFVVEKGCWSLVMSVCRGSSHSGILQLRSKMRAPEGSAGLLRGNEESCGNWGRPQMSRPPEMPKDDRRTGLIELQDA